MPTITGSRVLRSAVTALLAVAFAAALGGCGDGDDKGAGDDRAQAGGGSEDAPAVATARADDGLFEVTLVATPAPLVAGGPVEWQLHVENRTDTAISFTAPSALVADVVLLDGEREVWRWSEGRVFAQATSSEEVAPRATWVVRLSGTLTVDPGEYEVTAELKTSPTAAALSGTVRVVEGP